MWAFHRLIPIACSRSFLFPEDWAYRNNFSKLVFAVSDLFSGVKPVRYSQILELDQKLSEIVPPAHLKVPPEGSSMEADGPLLIMQRMIPVICGDGCMFFSIILQLSDFFLVLMRAFLFSYSRSILASSLILELQICIEGRLQKHFWRTLWTLSLVNTLAHT